MRRSAVSGLLAAVMGVSLLMSGMSWAGESEAYTAGTEAEDAGSEEDTAKRVGDILSSITTRQKIAQMFGIRFQAEDKDGDGQADGKQTELSDGLRELIREEGIGMVCLFATNIDTNAGLAELTWDIQDTLMGEDSVSKVPALISVDQEGGYITRLTDGTSMPGNMLLAASHDMQAITDAANIIGQELSAAGINVDFAPDSDVNSNPSNPIIGVRSFGSNPDHVAACVEAYLEGIKSAGVTGCLKHFPGHGDTATDSHTGLPLIDKSYDELKECELIPFEAGIKAGADMIMTAHIQFPQIETETYTSTSTGETINLPATMSKTILTDILRGDMGFDGIIITDAMGMDAIMQNYDPLFAVGKAIDAGANIILIPYPYYLSDAESLQEARDFIGQVADQADSGEISMDAVNDSVTRILTYKIEAGLLDADYSDSAEAEENASSFIGSAEHHEIEKQITEKGITLVKNEENMLPFSVSDGEKVLILYADTYRESAVRKGIEWIREANLVPEGAEITELCYQGKTASEYAEEIAEADRILILTRMTSAADLSPDTSNETTTDTSLANNRFVREAIASAHDASKKVAILSTHLPYDLSAYTDADAMVCAYNHSAAPDTSEEAAALGESAAYGPNIPSAMAMIFGEGSFSGVLPVDIPTLADDYIFTDEILYEEGFGLTTDGNEEA